MRDSVPLKPFELVWLDAAMSFTNPKERETALGDVADMTGRSLHAIRIRAVNRYADKLDAMADLRDRARRRYRSRVPDSFAPASIAPARRRA